MAPYRPYRPKKKRKNRKQSAPPDPNLPRPSEQMLLEVLPEFPAARVFCTSLGRAQLGRAYAEHFSDAKIACWFLDIYNARRAETLTETIPENLNILCTPDPPGEEIDLAILPLTQGGEAELTRETLQAVHQNLRLDGKLVVAIDNPRDTWLHGEMRALFEKVTDRKHKRGAVYIATKREPLKKLKDFNAEFKFRDREKLISVKTRPGVFSHRRLDTGARALMEVMKIGPGYRVLDLGCGAGVLSLAAALREPDVAVLAIDAHTRALQCTEQNAEDNGITSLATQLTATANIEEPGSFDVVLANPPYYSGFRIAEIFLKAARRALKPGGEVLLVTKKTDWYEENMPRQFNDVQKNSSRDYTVMRGIARDS